MNRHATLLIAGLAALLASACGGMDDGAESASEDEIDTRDESINASHHSLIGPGGKCVSVSSSSNGSGLKLAPCSGDDGQHWTFATVGLKGQGGKCADRRTGYNKQYELWPCEGGYENVFDWDFKGELRVADKCLHAVGNGENGPGTPIVLKTCNGSKAQVWQWSAYDNTWRKPVEWTDPLGGGSSHLCPGVTNTLSGSRIQLLECENTQKQDWNLTSLGFRNVGANRCLDLVGGDTASGTPTEIRPCDASYSQRMYLRGRFIDGGDHSLCMKVKDGATTTGTPIVGSTCTSSSSQTFTYVP